MLETPVAFPWGARVISVHETAQEAYDLAARIAALGIESFIYMTDPWSVAVPLYVDVDALLRTLGASQSMI